MSRDSIGGTSGRGPSIDVMPSLLTLEEMGPALTPYAGLVELVTREDHKRLSEFLLNVQKYGAVGAFHMHEHEKKVLSDELDAEISKMKDDSNAMTVFMNLMTFLAEASRQSNTGDPAGDAIATTQAEPDGTSGLAPCPCCGRVPTVPSGNQIFADSYFDSIFFYGDGSREWFSSVRWETCDHGLEHCQMCKVDYTARNLKMMKFARIDAADQRASAEHENYKMIMLRYSSMFDDDEWMRDLLLITNVAITLEIMVWRHDFCLHAMRITPDWPGYTEESCPKLRHVPFYDGGPKIILHCVKGNAEAGLPVVAHILFDLVLHHIIFGAINLIAASPIGITPGENYEELELMVLEAFRKSAHEVIKELLGCRSLGVKRQLDEQTSLHLAEIIERTVKSIFIHRAKCRSFPHSLMLFAKRACESAFTCDNLFTEDGRVNRRMIQEIREKLSKRENLFVPIIHLRSLHNDRVREVFIFSEHEKGSEKFHRLSLFDDTPVADIYEMYQKFVVGQKPHLDPDKTRKCFRHMTFELFVEEEASKPSVLAMQQCDYQSVKKEFLATKGKFPLLWSRKTMRHVLDEVSHVSGFRNFPEAEPIILRWLPADQARFYVKVRDDPRLDPTNKNKKEMKFQITLTVKVRQLLTTYCMSRKIADRDSMILCDSPGASNPFPSEELFLYTPLRAGRHLYALRQNEAS